MRFLFIFGLLAGCATAPKEPMLHNFDYYRAEMVFTIAGRTYKGLAVTPQAQSINIALQSPVALDRLEISSCSRHVVMRDVDQGSGGWWGSQDHSTTYQYSPTDIELQGNCPLHFQAFSKDVQKAWGMVFMRNDQSLPSHMSCNGSMDGPWAGISICQTKAGLQEEIKFDLPVKYAATPECLITPQPDNKTFQVRSSGGFCKATFSDGTRFNDLILLGYSQVVIY